MPRRRGRRDDLTWDDRTDADDPLETGASPFPRGDDEADVRWVPGLRGWVTVRDPFTGERWEVPTSYAPEAPHLPKAWHGYALTVIPKWAVYRAMDKLPPRRPTQTHFREDEPL